MADTTIGSWLRAGKGRKGVFTLNGATPVVVADKRVTIDSVIGNSLRSGSSSGTPGARTIQSVTAGVGFTIVGTAGDTNQYNYIIE